MAKRKIKVGVLRGGPSSEFDVSLKTGESVLRHMPAHFDAVDIFVDKKGKWHMKGLVIKPKDLEHRVDVVFNAMHGEFGEDGTVQKILETWHIPFTGSKSFASALGMHKILSKNMFKSSGIKVVHHKTVKKDNFNEDTAKELWKGFPQPSVVKPVRTGSSVGVTIVTKPSDLEPALKKAFEYGDEIMIEEFIAGKEATCGVLENFRGKDIYPLLPIEIIPLKNQVFFDYESKYSETNGAQEICPGNFSKAESEIIQKFAKLAHQAIGARHYSRTDFRVHPKRGVYALEINTLPGLTDQSLLPKEMVAIGSSYGDLLDHLINLALTKK